MQITNKSLKSEWVRFEIMKLDADFREFIKASGAIDAMWEWLPRLPNRGTTFDGYFDHIARQVKNGRMLPVMGFSQEDGRFVGGSAFMRINQTHRHLQIGFMWSPPELRGSPYTLAVQAGMIRAAMAWRAKRIFWTADTENLRLISFMEEKVQAKREGVVESAFRLTDGRWSDTIIYALVGDRIEEAVTRIESELAKEFAAQD